ncbi:MAG: ABC transporter substrate-binding protein [Clostridiales bacterium]|jgi:ABC-type transport system substrate-binding protein|nr:ABC transporter substrate-binding protein [Clostridiales bacterium]
MASARLAALLLAMLAALLPAALLAGCDGLFGAAQLATGEAAAPTVVNSGIYSSDYSLDEGPVMGGGVRIYATGPDTFNPLATGNVYVRELAGLVYEGLARMGPNLKAGFGLAESWSASEDGRVWTIALKRGVYWHDGAELTSGDVLATFDRIEGYGGASPYAQMISNIAACEADGRYGVLLVLSKPNAFTPETLIFPITPAHISIDLLDGASDSATLSRFLVGTGPYRFGSYEPGGSLKLVANEARRAYGRMDGGDRAGGAGGEPAGGDRAGEAGEPDGAGGAVAGRESGDDGDQAGGDGAANSGAEGRDDTGGEGDDGGDAGESAGGGGSGGGGLRPPYIDSVSFVFYPPSEQALAAYRDGAVDAFFSKTMDYSKHKDSIEMQVKLYSEREFSFLAFNCENGFIDISVRNAIARLIDKDAIVGGALGGKGFAASFPAQPESWLYDLGVPAVAHDPQAARSILEADGFRLDGGAYYRRGSDGSRRLELTLLANGQNAAHAAIADSIAETLGQNGISVIVQKEDYEALSQKLAAGAFDMALASYRVGPIPDMTELYSESWFGGGRSGNIARYANDDVDRIAGELYIDMDVLGRQAAFADLAAILNRDMPYVGLYFQASSLVLDNNIRGSIFPCSWEPFCDIGEWYIADYK